MRVVAGTFKGRRLTVPAGHIRPTSERLKESLFNSLGDAVQKSVWVDAFAGSGAVGIEALSRGADYVLFNDRSESALRAVRKNLDRCDVTAGYELLRKDVFVLLRTPPASLREKPVSFLFFDPPYDFGRYHKLLRKVLVSPLFDSQRTAVVMEIFKKTATDFVPPEMCLVQTLKGGDSHLLLLSSRC